MLTESELLRYRGIFFNESKAYKSLSKADAQVTIFLSHSHKDQELVEGLINYLAISSQIIIYVDWRDSDMPSATNRETAHLIKQKINDLDYFLVLATKNAMASKWVPWEIGIADTVKPAGKIAIIPVVDPSGQYQGNEYMQLYPSIQPGNLLGSSVLAVFEPNRTSNGMVIRSWLTR
jgi:hypothetical protein